MKEKSEEQHFIPPVKKKFWEGLDFSTALKLKLFLFFTPILIFTVGIPHV